MLVGSWYRYTLLLIMRVFFGIRSPSELLVWLLFIYCHISCYLIDAFLSLIGTVDDDLRSLAFIGTGTVNDLTDLIFFILIPLDEDGIVIWMGHSSTTSEKDEAE